MSIPTNRLKFNIWQWIFDNVSLPATYRAVLVRRVGVGNLDNAAAVDIGGTPNLVDIPITAHGLTVDERIHLDGTINYDGYYVVQAGTTANLVRIISAFTAETFTGAETYGQIPGSQTNLAGDAEVSEIPAGNGYTAGGLTLTPGTDFDNPVESDTPNNRGTLQIVDQVWTAASGPLPISGEGAVCMLVTDPNATFALREVYHVFDLGGLRTVSDTQQLQVIDSEMRALEFASQT